MSAKKKDSNTGNLMVNVFDGARKPFPSKTLLLVRVIDGNQRHRQPIHRKGPNIAIRGLPFFNNFGDDYTVVVSAKGLDQAGFTPVKLLRNAWQHVDLMLLPKNGTFNFEDARWEALKGSHPKLSALLCGAASDQAAKKRYKQLIKKEPARLAAFFNITTAMGAIQLPSRTPLDYLKQLIWAKMAQDRFFAYAEQGLIGQLDQAVVQGVFKTEIGSAVFHPGATRSYKQVQFGEANVQLTFHEGDTKQIGGVKCVKVEPDIDYHRDRAAHALLEVIPNTFSGRLTDPGKVYVLRWIAGRRAGVPEFNPPYVIA